MTYRDLMKLKALTDKLDEQREKRHSEDQPWRPNQIVGRFTPSAALVANNAIGRMMR